MVTIENLSEEQLKAHFCFESVDRVPADPETTAFKRQSRLKQALWREKMGLPIGSQPMRVKNCEETRPIGSRIELEAAKKSKKNFLSDAIQCAVDDRLAKPQRYQTLNEDRLFCDLLSSMPMCFNLFGTLQKDLEIANQAVHTWWPSVPGRVSEVLFEWSPGRMLPGLYLENRSAFDVAFKLELEDGSQGILGVETKYHENCKPEKIPSVKRCKRYEEVTDQSGVISLGAMKSILGTDLQQIWLDHLLALSMLQDPSQKWKWAGFVLVHPSNNPSYARASERYKSLLTDRSSFRVSTIESLLAADVLPKVLKSDFSKRYIL